MGAKEGEEDLHYHLMGTTMMEAVLPHPMILQYGQIGYDQAKVFHCLKADHCTSEKDTGEEFGPYVTWSHGFQSSCERHEHNWDNEMDNKICSEEIDDTK